MLKHQKKIIIGGIIASLMLSSSAFAWSSYTKNISVRFAQIKLIVNNKIINTEAEPFIYNENVYVPAATIANKLGIKQEWDNKTPSVSFTDPNAKIEISNSMSIDHPIGNGFHLWWDQGFQFTFEDRVNGIKIPIPVPEELEGKSEGQQIITDAFPQLDFINDSKYEFYMFHYGNNRQVFLQLLQYEKGILVSLGAIKVADDPNRVFGLYNKGRNTMYVQYYDTEGQLNSSAEYLWDVDTKKIKLITELKATEGTDWEPTIYETVNHFDGITMIVKEGTVSSTGLTVTLENNSEKQCVYGEHFLLEKKIKGRWYQVPVALDGNYGFDLVGYDLASSGVKEWTVDWDRLYGSLDTGEYRIVKDILDFRNTGDYDKYHLTAEFTAD